MRHLLLRDASYRAVLTAFEEYVHSQGYSPGSCAQLPSCVQEFLFRMEETGIWRLDLIGPQEVQAHYQYLSTRPNDRRKGGLSGQMLTHHFYSLRTFFTWLVRLEAIPFDPMTGLDLPRPYHPPRLALTEPQVGALYEQATTKLDRALLAIYYGCGLRRQEGIDLNVQDIDLLNGRLVVREGKYAKRRELPFPAQVSEDLVNYLRGERTLRVRYERVDAERAFLLNACGRRLGGGQANARIQLLARQAGLADVVTLHRLRHSIATHMKERGMAMEAIQQFLGHGSLDVTQAYITGYRLHWKKDNHKYPHRHDLRGLPARTVQADDHGALYQSTWRIRQTDR
jgi:integrase/recombinase XerD